MFVRQNFGSIIGHCYFLLEYSKSSYTLIILIGIAKYSLKYLRKSTALDDIKILPAY